jgi:Fe2+ or Zn2+ uptake regulation protein
MLAHTMWPVERLHAELRIFRLSRTHQRNEIYRAVGRLGPCEPVRIVQELSPKIDKRTIYRTIKTFANAQIIQHVGQGLIELAPPFRRLHYYVLCRGCGLRFAFWDEALEAKLNSIMARRRYVLTHHSVELSGLCELCSS